MLEYKKTPEELLRIINLFKDSNLNYVLFKCEHIFDGKNSNLDILFNSNLDYHKASSALEREGYVLYMPESVEKYKKMYVKVISNKLYAIHLHREIAWHGLIALNKKNVLSRKINLTRLIIVPSEEDYLLIHSAHILFENFKIGKTRRLIEKRIHSNLDWDYINKNLKRNGWKPEFKYLIKKVKGNKEVQKDVMIKGFLKKSLKSPRSWVPLSTKVLKSIIRKLRFKRKGNLIALIGVNGAGKSTLTKKTLEEYQKTSEFFNGQFGYYYGWEPFLPTTKLLSKFLRKKGTSVFKKLNENKKTSLFKELIFIYDYLEYLARYLFIIYPKLRNNKLVITDRYFYDIYGQHSSSSRSVVLKFLLSIFPRPDHIFILDAKIETIKGRKKETNLFSKKVKRLEQRKVHDEQYLLKQKERYKFLQEYFNGTFINTEEKLEDNVTSIINKTWIDLTK